MGLFSKEKSKQETESQSLPELPKINNLEFPTQQDYQNNSFQDIPELPEIETNDLPQLPEINEEPTPEQEIKKELNKSSPEFQKSQFAPLKPISEEDNIKEKSSNSIYSHQKNKIEEPVFIRIDKFQSAIETFEEIIDKVTEIEEIIKKTKEIKAREEEELNSWEKEIQNIKNRMDSIDKTIFSKLDLI